MSASAAPVLGRRAHLTTAHARTVLGGDLAAGDLLPTGLVLEVTRDDSAAEVRLEMPGADVHYVDYDEPVTVLARVDADVLASVSVGVFVDRHPPPVRAVTEADAAGTGAASQAGGVRRGKQNTGRAGQYRETVQHYQDVCPIHGETTFARHQVGSNRAGHPKYRRRCLACHSDYNLDNYHRRQSD